MSAERTFLICNMKSPHNIAIALLLACLVSAAQAARLAVITEDSLSPEAIILTEQLCEELEKTSGFTLVDRDQIELLIREHSLSVSGIVRSPLKTGLLLGANYLLYVTGGQTPTHVEAACLLIEVSSGNVLAEDLLVVPGDDADNKRRTRMLADLTTRINDAVIEAREQESLPSAVVVYVRAANGPHRLLFLETSIRNMLEEMLSGSGYRVLRRTHGDKLYKETTLSTMGMMRPDASVLAESAAVAIRGDLEIHLSQDKPFEDLPIALKLAVRHSDGSVRKHVIAFTPGTLSGLADKLPALVGPVDGTTVVKNRFDARREAASLMTQLKPLPNDTAPFRDPLQVHRQQIKIAQRVIYLDPTIKDAYYLLGMRIKGLQMAHQITPAELSAITAKKLPEKKLRLELYDQTHPMWREQVDAFMTYLQFPRTDFHKTVNAFFYLTGSLPQLWPDDYRKVLTVCADYAKWYSVAAPPREKIRKAIELNTTLLPSGLPRFDRWWNSQPELRAKWNEWVTSLYADKPARGDIELAARKHGPKLKSPLKTMYGDFAGIAAYEDIYEFSYHADDVLLGMRTDIIKAVPKKVSPGSEIRHTILARTTESGLWVQGITSQTNLVLLHSPEPGSWKVIDFEFQGKSMPQIIRLAQVGESIVMAAWGDKSEDDAEGLYLYNIQSGGWSHLGATLGVPERYVFSMCRDSKAEVLWLRGRETFKYFKGQIYMDQPKDKWTRLMIGERVQGLSNQLNGRQLLPVPNTMRTGPRGHNAGIHSKQTIVQSGGCVYAATPEGLVSMSEDDTRIWHPDNLCYMDQLTAFLKGNCPLPPATVEEVLQDDRNPDVLWIVSSHKDYIPQFHFVRFRWCAISDHAVLKREDRETRRFVTAFDRKKKLFSQPVEIPFPTFVHIAPRGDRLYFTGWNLGWLPKKTWVTDQAPALDGEVRVMHADTPFGRAAGHLVRGNNRAAMEELATVTNEITLSVAKDALRRIRGCEEESGNSLPSP